jgi:hypothetical protein
MCPPLLENWGFVFVIQKGRCVEQRWWCLELYLDTHWMVGLEVTFLFKFFLPSYVTRDYDMDFISFGGENKFNTFTLLSHGLVKLEISMPFTTVWEFRKGAWSCLFG